MTHPEDNRSPFGANGEGPGSSGNFDVDRRGYGSDAADSGADARWDAADVDFGENGFRDTDSRDAGDGDGIDAEVRDGGEDRDVRESRDAREAREADEAAAAGSRTTATGDGDATDKLATGMMAALIALAVVSSVVMLFTDSTGWMKIAVLAGLWAAVIGALLVTRYRRQLAAERERIADLEVMHELELGRELSTHREQELILEQNYLDSLDAKSDDTIAQLRAEITALREHLAELLGADLDEERIALRARAERLRELDAPPTSSPLKDPDSHQRPKPRATAHRQESTANRAAGATRAPHAPHDPEVTAVPEEWDESEAFESRDDAGEPVDVPVVGGGFNTGSFRAVPWQEYSGDADDRADETAETTDSADTTGTAPDADRESGAGHRREPDAAETSPTTVLPRLGDHSDSDSADDDAADTTAADEAAADEAEAETGGRRSRHGRRRAEENAGGLTVAELLAQMRERKETGE
ncbi:DUF6779 domain-containing protein [uncultured Corynebacterium sp.]|uniref:DUF6779 domain-containing protein n=1 Tax=uncultured Corynebacterium sp. TaxID=159447 RepID=UPI0025DD06A3|nr:DUF6779 domain-containing protein [uncultured Corynebacterium sp.]